jgi:hypothetical protein
VRQAGGFERRGQIILDRREHLAGQLKSEDETRARLPSTSAF